MKIYSPIRQEGAAVAAILSKARTAGGQRSLAAAARELDAELDTIPDSAAE